MKKKRSKAKRGRLYLGMCGVSVNGKWPWFWTVWLLPKSMGIAIQCERRWKTKNGARRYARKLMEDLGIIEVEEFER